MLEAQKCDRCHHKLFMAFRDLQVATAAVTCKWRAEWGLSEVLRTHAVSPRRALPIILTMSSASGSHFSTPSAERRLTLSLLRLDGLAWPLCGPKWQNSHEPEL
eukprot:gnl/TRDRNA2_/TRDRNA2_153300_c0_seq3.p1 gnl/TRDRNA2_/TRDRNA2_153300_c0~~gnl/TRDRNA2_/TRDRNA2_153300_c0_seq3.p1  ORF type:complete len:104 (-),score=1.09 gnl/TRDRNA2_/TRDRNA2_153300_c0_seq3:123-434(-)